MKLRKIRMIIVVAVLVVALATAVAILVIFLPERPALEEGDTYTFVSAEYWPDGYTSRQDLAVQGKETAILDRLGECTKRRSTELLVHRTGESIQIPEWPKLVLRIRNEEGSLFTYLIGEEQSQQREVWMSPPVYTLSGEGNLWKELSTLLNLSYSSESAQ